MRVFRLLESKIKKRYIRKEKENKKEILIAQMTVHRCLAHQGVSVVALLSTPRPKHWHKPSFGPFLCSWALLFRTDMCNGHSLHELAIKNH